MTLFLLPRLWRQLQRRTRQALFTALGLAVGAGLVTTVSAASSGVSNVQARGLRALYGIGTDVTFTTPWQPANATPQHLFQPGSTAREEDFLSSCVLGLMATPSVAGIARLTDDPGRWLAIAALTAAFAVQSYEGGADGTCTATHADDAVALRDPPLVVFNDDNLLVLPEQPKLGANHEAINGTGAAPDYQLSLTAEDPSTGRHPDIAKALARREH